MVYEIRDFRMSRMSGIEISSSQGLKKPPKMSPREEKAYLPRAAGPREVSFFFPRAYFKVFYNPRDEEISIPDINGHSENLFLFEFIYVQNLFFSVKSSCALVTRGGWAFSSQGLILRCFATRRMKKFLYLTSTAIRKTYSCSSLYMCKICFFPRNCHAHSSPGRKW